MSTKIEIWLVGNTGLRNPNRIQDGFAIFANSPYEELSTEQKQTIVHNWYESILSVLKADEKEEIEKTDILDWFIKNAERYDNIRILKTKLENAIFDRLSEVFIIS